MHAHCSDFGVNGIPEYVWIDATGRPKAVAVGRLPREVLEGNTAALATGQELPYNKVRSAASDLINRPQGRSGADQRPLDHA